MEATLARSFGDDETHEQERRLNVSCREGCDQASLASGSTGAIENAVTLEYVGQEIKDARGNDDCVAVEESSDDDLRIIVRPQVPQGATECEESLPIVVTTAPEEPDIGDGV